MSATPQQIADARDQYRWAREAADRAESAEEDAKMRLDELERESAVKAEQQREASGHANAVRTWLDNQAYKPGGISSFSRRLIERLISDLEAGTP